MENNSLLVIFSPELADKWINFLDVSPKTAETYTKALKQFYVYLQKENIVYPQRDDIIRYKLYLMEGHKPATVQAYITAVRLFFSWTAMENIYPDIARHVKGVKVGNTHRKGYLSAEQSAQLLGSVETESIKGIRDYAILSLMLTSGLRTIEIIRADICDIKKMNGTYILAVQGKGRDDKDEFIKVAEPVMQAVDKYLFSRRPESKDLPLFASCSNKNRNMRLTTRSISRIVRESLKRAGLDCEIFSAHSLRHTAATLNLLNGGTLEETQQLLRHSDINTTMIYSHALEREKNNSELRIAKAIFG